MISKIIRFFILLCVVAPTWIIAVSSFEVASQGGCANMRTPSIEDVIKDTNISSLVADGKLTGKGVRIGILDTEFDGLIDFIKCTNATIRLRDDYAVEVYDNVAGDDEENRHGTKVLQVIYSIAPDAELFLCDFRNYTEFVGCINWMIRDDIDVDIINNSTNVISLPHDGTNLWSQAVDLAVNSNTLWVNSAGNYARGYLYTNFNYVDEFCTSNCPHEWSVASGPNESLFINPATINTDVDHISILLSWEYPSDIDLDLRISFDQDAEPLESNSVVIDGTPLEWITIPFTESFKLQVVDKNGTARGRKFALAIEYVDFATLFDLDDGANTILAPADNPNVITVGALEMDNETRAPYSSFGTIRNEDNKPDIMTIGTIQTPTDNFVGTSAATPLVVGVAALLMQNFPDYDAMQIRNYILNNAVQSQTDTVQILRVPPISISPPIQSDISAPTQTPASIALPYVEITGAAGANLRSGPGLVYDVINNALYGELLPAVAEYGDNYNLWYQVTKDGVSIYWVSSQVAKSYGDVPRASFIPPTPTPNTPPIVPTNPPAQPTQMVNPPVEVGNTRPTLSNPRANNVCPDMVGSVDFYDPDGDIVSVLYAWNDGAGGFEQAYGVSGVSGVFSGSHLKCVKQSEGGQCGIQFQAIDSRGNRSDVVYATNTCP